MKNFYLYLIYSYVYRYICIQKYVAFNRNCMPPSLFLSNRIGHTHHLLSNSYLILAQKNLVNLNAFVPSFHK